MSPVINTLDKPKVKITVKDLTGGVNLKIHPLYLPDNTSAGLQDIDHSTPGLLRTRKGYTAVADEVSSTGKFTGIGYIRQDDGSRAIIGWLRATAPNGNIYKWTGGATWSAIVTGISDFAADADVFFLQYNNIFFIAQDGTDASSDSIINCSLATTNVESITTTSNSAFPIGTSMVYWQGRLWCSRNQFAMNPPTSNVIKPAYVWFSDPLTPASVTGPGTTVWDRTNNAIACGYGTGQKTVAIQPIRSTELIVFLTSSIERIQPSGDSLLSALGIPVEGSFSRDIIDPLTGCGARKTVQMLGSDIIFMDQFGSIRSLQRTALDASQGTKSLPLSDPINDGSVDNQGISDLNKSAISKCAAIVFGNRYYLSIPSTGSTVNDTTYVYDVTLGSWTGPWNFGFSHFLVSDVVTEGVWKLYGIKDAAPARLYEIESGTTDNGTAIAYTETTKRYDFGDIDRDKTGRLIIITCVSTDDADMLVEANVDGSGWTSLGSFNIGGSTETLPLLLPFTLGGGGITKGKFHLETLDRFNEIQFRFTCDDLGATVQKLGHSIYATLEKVRKEEDL